MHFDVLRIICILRCAARARARGLLAPPAPEPDEGSARLRPGLAWPVRELPEACGAAGRSDMG